MIIKMNDGNRKVIEEATKTIINNAAPTNKCDVVNNAVNAATRIVCSAISTIPLIMLFGGFFGYPKIVKEVHYETKKENEKDGRTTEES